MQFMCVYIYHIYIHTRTHAILMSPKAWCLTKESAKSPPKPAEKALGALGGRRVVGGFHL